MHDAIITIEAVSKRYTLDHRASGDGLRHSLERAVRSPREWLRSCRRERRARGEEFWALRDVNFSVSQGDVIGFIGRNGAGKSTLLKILSRITRPTRGRIRLRGRVASLLEVGTGFHPELTGRENVFLNGAVLGMSRAEITRKFDEIVAFSGVEKFLDTPVKRYSSGMYVRLAFAVAAHLEPEILVVDEVLAVGDAEFQKKCLGRMNRAAREGRTVLFVSHNISAVQSLCTRAIYLSAGRVVKDASVEEVLTTYANSAQQMIDEQPLAERTDRVGGTQLRIVAVEFVDAATGQRVATLLSGQDVFIVIRCASLVPEGLDRVAFAVAFFSETGNYLFSCNSETVGASFDVEPRGRICACRIRKWPLASGRYTFNVFATRNGAVLDWVKEAGYLDAENGDFYGTGRHPDGAKRGVLIDYEWEADALPAVTAAAAVPA
jgi:lipopolysaccharide transport system ATP-binding protein